MDLAVMCDVADTGITRTSLHIISDDVLPYFPIWGHK